jgi:amidophosphoribosyltransferase
MCGVIGIIGPEGDGSREVSGASPSSVLAAYEAYRGLLALQHRGQDAAGILSYDDRTRMFHVEKDLGLVSQAFNQGNLAKLTGGMAIGHTRYATAGTDGRRDIQPLVMGIPFGLGMAHNGNILNYFSLSKNLAEEFSRQLLTENDLEVMMHYWAHFLLDGGTMPTAKTFQFENIKNAAEKFFDTMVGGYALVGLMAGQGLVALRDPNGIRPLVLGNRETADGIFWCVASETSALTQLGYNCLRDVAPGEVIFIDMQGRMQSAVVRKASPPAPCMFEWVYFSGAESMIEGQAVYGVRLKLGERLALKAREAIAAGVIAPDIVMPVPDTSRTAAISVADILKLPYREGLIKNRYVGRSFILNSQEKREAAVEQKLIPIRSEIEGKSIFLVDDSVVRGTTSRKIVELLKKYGAKDVTLGITCPPIRYACYYGIDFPDPKVLIAKDRTIDEIAKYMGAKHVIYLDEDDLRQAIGLSELCMACLTDKYPTSTVEANDFSHNRQKARVLGEGGGV